MSATLTSNRGTAQGRPDPPGDDTRWRIAGTRILSPRAGSHFIKGDRLTEPMLNRVEAVIYCDDPCLSCSIHAIGQMPLDLRLLAPGVAFPGELRR
jgi:hypothetical protein